MIVDIGDVLVRSVSHVLVVDMRAASRLLCNEYTMLQHSLPMCCTYEYDSVPLLNVVYYT